MDKFTQCVEKVKKRKRKETCPKRGKRKGAGPEDGRQEERNE